MRGHPDRTAGVRAQGRKRQARRDRRARSRRRTAGDVIDRPRIMHRTVMGVVAGRSVGELHHLQRAQPDRAGILQALQRRRGRGRDEIAANLRAAGDHLAGLVIHVLVRQRHAVQRAGEISLCQRRVGGIGRRQRLVGVDGHERVETGLPLRDAVEAGLRHLARRDALFCDRLRDLGQRQQCGLGAHFATFCACTTQKRRGLQIERQRARDRRKALERRTDGIGDTRGDIGAHGHARDVSHCLDLFCCRSCHAVSAPFDGARLWPEPGIAI